MLVGCARGRGTGTWHPGPKRRLLHRVSFNYISRHDGAVDVTNLGVMLLWLGSRDGHVGSLNRLHDPNLHYSMLKVHWQCIFRPFIKSATLPIRAHVSALQTQSQATGVDAWASRVKCAARFVSHLHDICIWVVYSFCLVCCLFIIVTTQFVAWYKPCKPKPKPSTHDPPDNHPLAEIQRPMLRPEPKQQICHQHANTDHFGK